MSKLTRHYNQITSFLSTTFTLGDGSTVRKVIPLLTNLANIVRVHKKETITEETNVWLVVVFDQLNTRM
jgi:hypothetical protein